MDFEHYFKDWWSGKPLKSVPKESDHMTFWSSLLSTLSTPIKSVPFESYDFYHDCILRHADKNLTAVIDGNRWSYAQIHQLVSSQLPIWTAFGCAPGKTVAIILPKGIAFTVALMTALRLGLTITILPLDDPYLSLDHLKRSLEQIAPELIVTLPGYKDLGKEVLELELEIKQGVDLTSPSHTYTATDTVFTSIDTNTAFLCPLRDGLSILPLKEGTVWARPLSSPIHDEPFGTLASLIAGATLFHIKDSDLLSNPECLLDSGIEVLGISHSLLELWKNRKGCPHSKLRFWYKSPLLGNLTDWNLFNETSHLKKVPCSDILIEPKQGGCILASQPKPYMGQAFLVPSVGMPWEILDLNNSGEPTIEGVGYFSLEPKLILGQVQDSWVISWSKTPIHKGTFYQTEDIETCVESLDFVSGCVATGERDPKDIVGSYITLLIFTSPEHRFTETASWENLIEEKIKEHLGSAFLPDQIFFYPFFPNRKEGKINRNWAIGQYQSGSLSLKKKSHLYHQLNLFRKALYQNLMSL